MYYFTRLSHIVDEVILPADMRVWVVCTHTRTRLPDGYMMLLIYVPAGRNIIPYPSPYRVKPVGYSGFGYLLPSLVQVIIIILEFPSILLPHWNTFITATRLIVLFYSNHDLAVTKTNKRYTISNLSCMLLLPP
jgi:hypothetical protein